MCGIAGVLGSNDRDVVVRMLGALAHRGPDDEHVVDADGATLGARRLSIIDVEGGRQPVSNEDGTVIAVQNGELYNFPQLRQTLAGNGHHFRSRTDTEILPHVWEESGVDTPTRIDGMFAVAIWDSRTQEGLLARDRMGKKPLYYWCHEGALYFASELKALLCVPGIAREIDLEAFHHYLSYKHVPHPLTIFKNVRMLPPGHRLVWRRGRAPEVSSYWSLSFRGSDGPVDEHEAVEELLKRLRAAVKRRLISDVPIGFFLSGGIDSSLTTALAAEVAPGRLKTFTLTYEGDSSADGKEQDKRWAAWVAQRFETEHHEESISFGSYPENLRSILRAFDEPFAGVVSTYFLAQRMARHVKVAVAGDGADELFGSYLSHRIAAGLEPPPLAGAPDWAWRARLLVFSDEEKAALYSPAVRDALSGVRTEAHLARSFAQLTARDPLNRMLEAEFSGIFPDQVLTFVDRLSMAHSLEVRSAFLDTDVVEFVASLPGNLKIARGETKYLLKQAARRYFPEEMVSRRKEGFLMPVAQWMRSGLEEWVRSTLSPSRLGRHNLFEPARVQELVDSLYRADADYRVANKVLALLVFQEWHEMYMP